MSQVVDTADRVNAPIGGVELNSQLRGSYPEQHDIESYFQELQSRICAELEDLDGQGDFTKTDGATQMAEAAKRGFSKAVRYWRRRVSTSRRLLACCLQPWRRS
jgi:hypothetical protein